MKLLYGFKNFIKQLRPYLPKKRVYLPLSALIGSLLVFSIPTLIARPAENISYGTSFSVKYAQSLGLDWQEAYTAILEEQPIDRLRLMSYWDHLEPKPGKYDFSELDWQMDTAEQYGKAVTLAVGLRQPRWPECHRAPWVDELSPEERKQAILNFVEQIVRRYRDHPALESYQLENEALNTYFGECSDHDRDRLIEELQLIQKLDWDHPVYMSQSDQLGLPLRAPHPDGYGFSIYQRRYIDSTLVTGYIPFLTPKWYHQWRAQVIRWLHPGDKVFVHELQLEPWGPTEITQLDIEEINKTLSLAQAEDNLHIARNSSMQEIDIWGAEWWYWLKQKKNDNRYWDFMQQQLR